VVAEGCHGTRIGCVYMSECNTQSASQQQNLSMRRCVRVCMCVVVVVGWGGRRGRGRCRVYDVKMPFFSGVCCQDALKCLSAPTHALRSVFPSPPSSTRSPVSQGGTACACTSPAP
jgi:hypothetical protein